MRIKGGLSMIPAAYRALLESALSLVACLALMVGLVAAAPAAGGEGVLAALASPAASAVLLACAVALLVRGQAAVSALSRRITERFSAQDGAWERRMVYFMDLIAGERADGKVERVFGMRDMLMGAFDQTNRASVGFYDRWRAGNRRVAVASTGVNGAFIVASYLIVAVKVLAGAITIGAFTQYAGALAQLGTAWSNLVSRNNDLREHCSYLEEFLAILDMPEASERGSIPPEKRDDGEYELAFEHVSFSYPGSSEEILHDVTLKLGMRRKMAVVGPNGAGKSTFIKLLCRLYRPTSGRITLNGIDIEKYDEDEYRDLMAVVFQDFRLFAFPVWENLAAGYARDDARLWAALDQADAGFVRAWPEGLETRLYNDLGQGVSPSGGQAQKLALARALYKDAPVVILDEPTAPLDPISEAEVYAGFDRMVAGKTAIYISHRMSSCRFCDDIIVFDGGRVVERGGHEGLLAAGGLYASLWNAQASYYVDGEKNVGAQKS
ncbi:ABC transporter ATP-binding protein [Thermophilibacter provencensis]|uniref:ABC transporter ATP-binding protein n=1 Tax=Thermophilibacter provencensis TaxID=1852386 RepID=UPI002355C9B1|nr:ABC transporter ATP-binding protein [Thermophilibacter provencensis]